MANPSLLDLYDKSNTGGGSTSNNLIPDTAGTYDIGSDTNYYKNAYINGNIYAKSGKLYIYAGTSKVIEGDGGSGLNRVWSKNSSSTLVLHGGSTNAVTIQNYADTATAPILASKFNTSSSKRYKENIENISLEEVNKLYDIEVVKYNYINDEEKKDEYGVIAEQLDEIGITSPISYDEEGRPDAICYAHLVPYLIKAAQEQKNEISIFKEKADKFDKLSALLVEKNIITKDELKDL